MRKGDGESVSTTGAKTIHPIHGPAMTTLNSRLQLAMLNRKKGAICSKRASLSWS